MLSLSQTRKERKAMTKLLSYEELNARLSNYITRSDNELRFVAENDHGEMRIGVLNSKTNWYAEVSNFQASRTPEGVDYCDTPDADEASPDHFRFFCAFDEFDDVTNVDYISHCYETALSVVNRRDTTSIEITYEEFLKLSETDCDVFQEAFTGTVGKTLIVACLFDQMLLVEEYDGHQIEYAGYINTNIIVCEPGGKYWVIKNATHDSTSRFLSQRVNHALKACMI